MTATAYVKTLATQTKRLCAQNIHTKNSGDEDRTARKVATARTLTLCNMHEFHLLLLLLVVLGAVTVSANC
ncbi:hypothetical protein C0J52_21204 [Blattella germanica]|nr:hypothetical protein C0J52_21204 [Blattella germanica]